MNEPLRNILGSIGCLGLVVAGTALVISGYAIHGIVIYLVTGFLLSKVLPSSDVRDLKGLKNEIEIALQKYNKKYPFGALGEKSREKYSPVLRQWKVDHVDLHVKISKLIGRIPSDKIKKDKFKGVLLFVDRYKSINIIKKEISRPVILENRILDKPEPNIITSAEIELNPVFANVVKNEPLLIDDSIEVPIVLKNQDAREDIRNILNANGISFFYHFTDISNIPSIIDAGGLLSYKNIKNNDIDVQHFGSSYFSRRRDNTKGLGDYVRLSFTRHHPMMYFAKKDGRLPNPVVLQISADVAVWKDTLFADKNALRNDFSCGSTLEDFKKIKMDVVKQTKHFDLSDEDMPYYQAEIMVKGFIPVSAIMNLNKFL